MAGGPGGMAGRGAGAVGTRRGALGGAAGLLLLGPGGGRARAGGPPRAVPPAGFELFVGRAGFEVARPRDWLAAYDRARDEDQGAVALLANLRSEELLAVRFTERNLLREGEPAAAAAERLRDRDPRALEVVMQGAGTTILSGDQWGTQWDGAPDEVLVFDYFQSTCRGERREEGPGGRPTCLGAKGDLLVTPQRHHLQMVAPAHGGGTFVVGLSMPEKLWGESSGTSMQVLKTFRSLEPGGV